MADTPIFLHVPHIVAVCIHTTGCWVRLGGLRGPGFMVNTRGIYSTRLHGRRLGPFWFRWLEVVDE